MLLRTHTSPVQIRTMDAQKPPIRMITPGRTYLRQRPDPYADVPSGRGAGHRQGQPYRPPEMDPEEFCKAFFEVDSVKMRFRPSFFPFTEPSMEVDIGCDRSGGRGEDRRRRRLDGDPRLRHGAPECAAQLRARPDEYQGFAWGMGIDRSPC
jgi:phenylalanyl-tRNA synthetase alpha chain